MPSTTKFGTPEDAADTLKDAKADGERSRTKDTASPATAMPRNDANHSILRHRVVRPSANEPFHSSRAFIRAGTSALMMYEPFAHLARPVIER